MGSKYTFDKGKMLGEGAYGTVFQGTWDGKLPVAVKRILLGNNDAREETALKTLSHDNIIKLIHDESDADFRYNLISSLI